MTEKGTLYRWHKRKRHRWQKRESVTWQKRTRQRWQKGTGHKWQKREHVTDDKRGSTLHDRREHVTDDEKEQVTNDKKGNTSQMTKEGAHYMTKENTSQMTKREHVTWQNGTRHRWQKLWPSDRLTEWGTEPNVGRVAEVLRNDKSPRCWERSITDREWISCETDSDQNESLCKHDTITKVTFDWSH